MTPFDPTLNIVIAGQKRFGRDVARMILETKPGWRISAVSCPAGDDKLNILALNEGLPVIPAGKLRAGSLPEGTDLIIAAHCHDFIGLETRLRSRWGAIGYHPSLLPLHRGRDAVRWTVRLGERVTGGSVYWLNETVDGGPVLKQRHIFVPSGTTATSLWADRLAPLGIELLSEAMDAIALGARMETTPPQDHTLATWFPCLSGQPPLFRPELLALPG